ncbi:type I-E CRISPR-associated protein Cse1/CasA [Corynebacterium kutscheri]|uniref:type I-E CRISPR-associated protein Cse1/CasA n=1 Tax=Corynebacterium kutscheri TaxID=35755 RepID=UPI0037C068D0
MESHFNLLDEKWIKVIDINGIEAEISIHELLSNSSHYQAFANELPTINFAILRLLLAILEAALLEEYEDDELVEEWKNIWETGSLPIDIIDDYLTTYRHRFYLIDETYPFLQVPTLATAKNEWKKLDLIVIDSPGEGSLFTRRTADVLDLAEAARWLVHANSFDFSGIKSGAVGDDRVKGGKGYPQGIGWCGWLGGTTIIGRNLFETLMLNFVAEGDFSSLDKPIWEEEPLTAAARPYAQPHGQKGLFTWPQRRIRLKIEENKATGVLVCNGDPIDYTNQLAHENMTAWRYSEPQSKKAKKPVYMPRALQSEKMLWQGLSTLLPSDNAELVDKTGILKFKPAKNVEWVGRLIERGVLPYDYRIQLDVVTIEYGTQNASVEKVLHDSLRMSAALASIDQQELQSWVQDAVSYADKTALAVTNLAADLIIAEGYSGDKIAKKREQTYAKMLAAIDPQFRNWLSQLSIDSDGVTLLQEWIMYLRRLGNQTAQQLLQTTSSKAWSGRKHNDHIVNVGTAASRFSFSLAKILPTTNPLQSSNNQKGDSHDIINK